MKRGKVTILATSYMLPADQGLLRRRNPAGPGGRRSGGAAGRSAGTAAPAPSDRGGDEPMNQLNASLVDPLPRPRGATPVAGRPGARDRAGRDPGAAFQAAPTLPGARRRQRRPCRSGDRLRRLAVGLPAGGQHGGSKSSEIRKNLQGFDRKDPFKVQGLATAARGSARAERCDRRCGSGAETADRRYRHRHAAGDTDRLRDPAPRTRRARPAPVTARQSGSQVLHLDGHGPLRRGRRDNSTRSAWSSSAPCPAPRTRSWSSWA